MLYCLLCLNNLLVMLFISNHVVYVPNIFCWTLSGDQAGPAQRPAWWPNLFLQNVAKRGAPVGV